MQTENQLNEHIRKARLEAIELTKSLLDQLWSCDYEAAKSSIVAIDHAITVSGVLESVLS